MNDVIVLHSLLMELRCHRSYPHFAVSLQMRMDKQLFIYVHMSILQVSYRTSISKHVHRATGCMNIRTGIQNMFVALRYWWMLVQNIQFKSICYFYLLLEPQEWNVERGTMLGIAVAVMFIFPLLQVSLNLFCSSDSA